MSFNAILIANRGEIAIRIARAAADLGIRSVAVYSEDDSASLHTRVADESVALAGIGARAYLDMAALIRVAQDTDCDAIHPGYGFLSEQADFAALCADAGITFIGPQVRHLTLFGDKASARAAALKLSVAVPRGLDKAVTLTAAKKFFASLGPEGAMIIKAVAGGGGRGTRAVTSANAIEDAFQRCQSEAKAAFGVADVYVEEFLTRARHLEVQIVGDAHGNVVHLGERECSIQRRYQKIVEVAPAPALDNQLRGQILDAAVRFAGAEGYSSLGTFEFLVDDTGRKGAQPFVFIEANARLQVEHTVTEEVTGVDLVQTQIRLAAGESLADLGLDDPAVAKPSGYAIQARVNMETIAADGSVLPAAGTLTVYEPPGGPGVRTDGFGYAGYQTSMAFDSLLAKVIVHSRSSDFAVAIERATRALSEFRIDGVASNIGFLMNILGHPDLAAWNVHTRWVDEHQGDLAVKSEARDPLALFSHAGGSNAAANAPAGADIQGPDGTVAVTSLMHGTIVSLDVEVGDPVRKGQQIAVTEAMKMEHIATADVDGIVRLVAVSAGDIILPGYPLVFIEEADVEGAAAIVEEKIDPDFIRPDLQENYDRHALTLDENRPEAVEKRHGRGHRMPRENIAQLVDAGSFKEYWPLIVARQHQRHDIETLRKQTPADGLIAGIGTINAGAFGEEAARAMVTHYDYTVLAGTQGARNHYKLDRMFELAERFRLPVIHFGEGGGGRPGDDDVGQQIGMDCQTFTMFSNLSGLVPLVGITNGRCFAGNTIAVACCDIIIATEGSTIGMGGPAMIEGGGLGHYTPEEVGPMSFQVPNGVVDILTKNEEEAIEVAKKYLSYFQGSLGEWEAPDQRHLRHVVPENRVRLYDMHDIINTIADKESVLEIREKFGLSVITAFLRIEGRPMGVIANNPHHLSGAIDSDSADKGARFMQLCDAFDIPILSLMDCPGVMVGPDVERTGLVRHSARMFNTGANLTTPLFGVVIRKGYGLGVQAMCGGNSLFGFFMVAWPTAEFAAMNIEGSVKLGYRKELMAIEDLHERQKFFDEKVERAYNDAKAVNGAMGGGLDDVIDPADTRDWIAMGLKRVPPPVPRTGKKRPFIDTW